MTTEEAPAYFTDGHAIAMTKREKAAIELFPLFVAEELKGDRANGEAAMSATLRTLKFVDTLLEGLKQ